MRERVGSCGVLPPRRGGGGAGTGVQGAKRLPCRSILRFGRLKGRREHDRECSSLTSVLKIIRPSKAMFPSHPDFPASYQEWFDREKRKFVEQQGRGHSVR